MTKIIVNTSPLIALDRIGCLLLLPALFHRITSPQSVLDEVIAGRMQHGASEDLLRGDWLETLPDPPEAAYRPELGAGETAAIALAVQEKADLILLDDLAARNVARELGLKVSGTLGVLITGFKKGHLADLDQPLNSLRATGFHMSAELIRFVRNEVHLQQDNSVQG